MTQKDDLPRDRSAKFVGLLTSHQPQMYAYIYAALLEDSAANDVLQDTNLVLWSKADQYDFDRPFLPWAFGFARQRVMAYRKTCSRSRLVFSDEALQVLSDECEEAIGPGNERLAALQTCLKRLKPDQADLIRERYSAKRPVQSIAKRIKTTANNVSSQLYRIRKTLAACVEHTLASERR